MVTQGRATRAIHHVNAYQRGGEIIVDLCGYDDAGIIGALYLDRLRLPSHQVPAAQLRRYRLPLAGGDAIREPLPEVRLELPRIDYDRRNGRPYRYAYGVGTAAGADAVGGFPDRITKADVDGGAVTEWAEPGTYPGEPVFVRTPGRQREDDGVLLSVVLDPAAGTSFLLVLDAASLGEIARARVPPAARPARRAAGERGRRRVRGILQPERLSTRHLRRVVLRLTPGVRQLTGKRQSWLMCRTTTGAAPRLAQGIILTNGVAFPSPFPASPRMVMPS